MIVGALDRLARNGRLVLLMGLVLGVLAGVALPDLAGVLQALVAPVVVTLLFLAVLRLGPDGVRAGLAGWRAGILTVLVLQLVLPCLAVLALRLLQVESVLAFGLVLVLAAAPITGSPNLAIMSGASAPVALRQLVMGTLLLPATALPVFLLMPGLGAPSEVFSIVLRLLVVIALAGALGLWLRASKIVTANTRTLSVIDGCTTLLLALIVIALMGAVGPALLAGIHAWGLLLFVLGLGFGLQLATLLVTYGKLEGTQAAAISQAAGNRNIALFLGVLPPALASDLLLFIGLYQIPMYLTPAVMGWVYTRMRSNLA